MDPNQAFRGGTGGRFVGVGGGGVVREKENHWSWRLRYEMPRVFIDISRNPLTFIDGPLEASKQCLRDSQDIH